MNYKKYAIFALIFLAIAFIMGMVSPSIPKTGNPNVDWIVSGGISGIAILFVWEKWGRKESGERGSEK
jgi:hypothetical protein